MAANQSFDPLKALLETVMDNHWLEGVQHGKTEEQIRREWANTIQNLNPMLGTTSSAESASLLAVGPPSPSLAKTTVEAIPMQRRRTDHPISKPAQPVMECSQSNPRKRANSSVYAAPPQGPLNARSSMTACLSSQINATSQKMARTKSNPRPAIRVDAQNLQNVQNVKTYEPADYISQTSVAHSHFRSNSSPQNVMPGMVPSYISSSPVVPSPLSSSYNSSAPPLTPDSTSIQSASMISPSFDMSRQGSLGGGFRNEFSNALSFNTQTTDDSEQSMMSNRRVPRGHSTNQRTSNGMYSTLPISVPEGTEQEAFPIAVSAPETSILTSFDQQTPKANELLAMRHASTGNINQSGPTRRPQIGMAERLLKPKVLESEPRLAPLASHQMIRISSDNGGATEKYQISKAPYSRPQKEKLKCKLCDKYPNGFRGDHELRRHQKLLHSRTRSAWICLDASEDGNMLSKCRHCREQKQYGAYYNAAAHLRRCHFNPKQGGRKARGQSDRAGKGGGDWPPMEELKNRWMKEIGNVSNNPDTDDDDDDDEDEEEEEEDAMAEQMAQDEVEAEDQQAHGLSFDGSTYTSSLPMNFNGFMTVADAGIFGGYGGSFDFVPREPAFDSFDPMPSFDDDDFVFGFEPPTTNSNV